MSDNNDEFKDAKNCKEIIQHKNKVDSITENKIKEYEGKRAGKTKKRKNKKSKSHKNKTKGKKNKSKSKKKTSLNNYDIYRMPY